MNTNIDCHLTEEHSTGLLVHYFQDNNNNNNYYYYYDYYDYYYYYYYNYYMNMMNMCGMVLKPGFGNPSVGHEKFKYMLRGFLGK